VSAQRSRTVGIWVAVQILALVPAVGAAPASLCLECHSDTELATERQGQTVSLFVDPAILQRSVHRGLECDDCHMDVDVENLPHPERLQPVHCATCHDDAQVDFDASIHGQALNRNAPFAPSCRECHGTHDISSPKDPKAPTYKMNVPFLCGRCHREGAPVSRYYDISEHNILENYSESVHGEALFKKGLIVTATCTDCHEAHRILPHTNPLASIAPRNIAKTCMKCHTRIEQVHVQVIRGELWEKQPGAIPACSDCHLPHKVRKESMDLLLSDRDCMKCHAVSDVHKVVNGAQVPLTVSLEDIAASVHQNIACVKCHSDVDPRRRRPCETAGAANCSNCHVRMQDEYRESGHGKAFAAGVKQAPTCTTCHGTHRVLGHQDEAAPVYRASVPELCGKCHRADGAAGEVAQLSQTSALADYSSSVHGRGLTEKGLLPSAVCIDCHGAHLILGHDSVHQ
jgi:hypothetical protein